MASGGAIKAGQAWVGLGVVDTALVAGLKSAERRVLAFGKLTASIGTKTMGAGAAVLAPLATAAGLMTNRAADIRDLSDQLGIGTEKVSAMAYAFESSGVSLNEFGADMKAFQSKMFAVMDGSDEMTRRIGLNYMALRKMPLEKQFDTILEKVDGLVNATDRAEAGAHFFGASWSKAQNTALSSMDAWHAAQEKAKKGGGIISEEQATQGKELVMAMNRAWQELMQTIFAVGAAFLPLSQEGKSLSEKIAELGQAARKWIADNREVIVTVATVAAGLVAAGAAVMVFSSLCTALGTILSVVTGIVTLLSGALGLLFSTGGLILMGVVAVAALAGAFDGLGSTFSEAWGGIMAAISSGDISLALKIAGAAMETIWATVVANLTEIWVAFKSVVVDAWHSIVDTLSAGLIVLKTGIRYFTEGEEKAGRKGHEELDQLQVMRAREKAERDAFRSKQINDARAREDAARAELAALVSRAKAGRAAKPGEESARSEESPSIDKNGRARKGGLADPMILYGAAKGTFGNYSGQNLQQSLGYGDNIAQRNLDTAKQILKANEAQVKLLGGIGAVAWK